MASSFAEVQALDSHTYQGKFPDEWSIGNVPHGGFVTSCFLSAAALHFATTHAARNQPHTITLHLSFLRRTSIGPARFTVRDVKLGRRTSTLHVALTQPDNDDDDDPEPSVLGYLTQSNLGTEQGISLPTGWSLHPPPLLLLHSSTAALKADRDPNWTRARRLSTFRKAAARTEFYLPRQGQLAPAMADEWIRLADGGRFTQTALGFVVDQFPQIVEIHPDAAAAVASSFSSSSSGDQGADGDGDGGRRSREEEAMRRTKWYPTVLLNLDVKKALPEEGVEWLFVRVRAKRIQNGRMDLEVVVLDEEGDLVAVSDHVCLIVGAERNTTRRGRSKV
ncbi:MAG: hypothetical protein L6R36_005899 [Xanthoria steineri]|nr:MAG: hypothetical protein L6R36_005899 [Xanthoria steineri]